MSKKKNLEKFGRTISILEETGIEAREYERMSLADSLTGGEDVINSELSEEQAILLSILDAINDPIDAIGNPVEELAYDCPVIRAFTRGFKRNMISHKRKGRIEVKSVMKPDPEDDSLTGKIKAAIRGGDQ